MLFATGCSGINSCAEAWIPLGWEEVFCAEVEPFPAAVLAHRYGCGAPEVLLKGFRAPRGLPPYTQGAPPNLGDFTRPDFVARAKDVLAGRHLNVFCAGTPCQGYSVAGLRGSMGDPRSNLMFCFVEAFHGLGSTWAVWENVPGCLNTPDNAFGHLLGGLARAAVSFTGPDPREPGKWPSAGVFQGPAGGGAWRVLDAQFLGGCELHGRGAVPQRRERVFVVFRAGADGHTRSAAVLFDPRGEGRDLDAEQAAGSEIAAHAGLGAPGVAKCVTARQTAGRLDPSAETYVVEFGAGVGPARDAREGSAARVVFEVGAGGGSFPGVHPTLDSRCKDGPIRNQLGAGVIECVTGQITHALKAEGADGSEDGTGRGVHSDDRNAAPGPVLPGADGVLALTVVNARQDPICSHVAQPLDTDGGTQAIAFGSKEHGQDAGHVSPPLRAGGSNKDHANGVVPPAVVYDARGNGAGSVVPCLTGDHASRPTDYTPVVVEVQVFEPRFARNGRGAPDKVSPPLKAENGSDGRGDGAPVLFALMPQNSGKDFKAKEAEVSQPLMAAGPTTGNQGGDVLVENVAALLPFDTTQLTSAANRSNPKPGDPCHPLAAGAHPPAFAALAGGCAPAARYVVRRFTCRETERLQGFSGPKKTAIIEVCQGSRSSNVNADVKNLDQQGLVGNAGKNDSKGTVLSAGIHLNANDPKISEHVAVLVSVNLLDRTIQIANKKQELLWSASYAEGSVDSTHLIKADAFARLVAGIVSSLARITQSGAAESPTNKAHSSRPLSGKRSARIYGSEIDALAKNADRFTVALDACSRSITSADGANSQDSDSSIQTSYCCALAAIVSFIPEKIKTAHSYVVKLEVQYPDHTLIPWTGTKRKGQDLIDQRAYLSASGYTPEEVEALVHCPDGPRYKAVGNSKAVPVVRWIGERIAAVDEFLYPKK